MSVEKLITEHIDIWTAATQAKSASGRGSNKKHELYGIKKLRELILELAVRGKLVPQDPSDEPASVLLERIDAEKARLEKEGKIKKPKALPEIAEDEKPFALPVGWEWGRVNELSKQVTDGVHHTPKYIDEGVPFISVKDLDGKTVSFDDCKYISYEQHVQINQRCNPELGDILLCRIGTLGRATVVDTSEPFSLFVSVGLLKFFNKYLISNYLHKVFHSPLLLRQYDEIKAGGSHTNKLNLADIPKLLLPVPPLEEQHRIVAKVDELMALCDQLELQTDASIEAHQQLVTVLLGSLLLPSATAEGSLLSSSASAVGSLSSSTADEFMANWARISDHFDTLFTTEASIDALKQTILQLAVMGKLVPQDPNDEPASVLLERIAAEKARLVKEKKIKKDKPLPAITEDEKPFPLPKGWEWSRVGTFSNVGTGATPSRSNPQYWEPAEFNWLSSGETSELFIGETKEKVSSLAVAETNVTIYPTGTLVMAMYGQGKTRGQITELLQPAGTNQACAAIQLHEKHPSHREYVKFYFRKAYDDIRSEAAGGAQPNLNVGKVANTVIAIPPLEEQRRIVPKVNELFSICDQLKQRLSDSQQTQLKLTDALVDGALA